MNETLRNYGGRIYNDMAFNIHGNSRGVCCLKAIRNYMNSHKIQSL